MGADDIVDKAKGMLGRDRGAEDLKEDAEEVKDDVTSDESTTDKAKDVFEDVKDPGAPG